MISLSTGKKLKDAGLVWKPSINDYFVISDRGMDDKVFVISDIQVSVEILYKMQVVSFQGTSEWALDSLVISEVVWLPREDQLRVLLETELIKSDSPEFQLLSNLRGCHLNMICDGVEYHYQNRSASEVYAQALLEFLEKS